MKISIIANHTFTAALPDDLNAVHQYGSEGMSAILASALSKSHNVDFYAPVGSSRIGNYHPTRRTDGKYLPSDLLADISLDNSKHDDLLLSEFVIDCTPWGNNIQQLALYNDYYRYLCYRLGYKDYTAPALEPILQHHITHCDHFARLFEQAGHPNCHVAHFGISDFWSPARLDTPDDKYFDWIGRVTSSPYWNMTEDSPVRSYPWYYLFPHRYNREKGSFDVVKLAKEFPNRTFVFSSAAVSPDHHQALQQLRSEAPSNCKFVQIPSSPDREFYRRELYRNAIATLAPFQYNMNGYHDTGGILSMESIKCDTPIIVTRSEGSEEIFGHQQDRGAVFIDGYESLKMAIKYVDFLSLHPVEWKWSIDNYVNEYMQAIHSIIG